MSCYNSTTVNAPIETVWKTIRNFHALPWATGVIESVKVVGDIASDQPGAKRILNDAFHETLTAIDDQEFTFSYSIDDGPEPISKTTVSNYIGKVRLLPVTDENTTFVEWTSTYTSNAPAAVSDFCNPIYTALLAALKRHF